MKVYTYSQARQELAKLLEEAWIDGEIGIKKRDGQTFILKSVRKKGSPLDIESVNLGIRLEELNEAVRESSKRE